jgi:ADP-ribose pyrophosphatase YjhB (NUDIX family)
VPGGRIYKNEDLDEAFKRITLEEVGRKISRSDATFIGLFTHKYNTNFLNADGVTTHYVVLAYEIYAKEDFKVSVLSQHSEFKWFSLANMDANQDVHQNSLEYFHHLSQINDTQYSLLNARRDTFNSLLWQTPVLSLTAQAFLFTIILSCNSGAVERVMASSLSFITALASIQLLGKHRFMEEQHAKILHDYERNFGLYGVNRKMTPNNRFVKMSSYQVWFIVLSVFAFAALLAIASTIFSAETRWVCSHA